MKIQIEQPQKHTDSIIFKQETGFELFVSEGVWFIDGAESEQEALSALENHNPENEAIKAKEAKELAQAKLAALGLTADDLKALGL
jgi:hypothetical protein